MPERIKQVMYGKDWKMVFQYFCDWEYEFDISRGQHLNRDDKITLNQTRKNKQTLAILLQQVKHVSLLSKAEANSVKKVQKTSLGIIFNLWKQYPVLD